MNHQNQVEHLQKQIRQYSGSALLALKRHSGHSNTTRSKSYNQSSHQIISGPLDQMIHVDQKNKIVRVQPRITMENLVKVLAPYGLIPPIVPEFKGITVGGAIMGAAAESYSHKFGIFSDICTRYELIAGDGRLITSTPTENRDLFYGLPGSYGSLGLLVSVDIQLIEVKKYVHVQATHFTDLNLLIDSLRNSSQADFLDAIVYSKNHGVIIEGQLTNEKKSSKLLSETPFSPWFYHHHKKEKSCAMTLSDYLFRFDRGAFWMGAYLLQLPLLARFLCQGVFKITPDLPLTEKERKHFHAIKPPTLFQRALSHQWMPSQKLWKLLHKAENWVHDRFVIQDFCIPETNATAFLKYAIAEAEIFPLWICPIKGTREPQIFAPHLLPLNRTENHFINIGIYGMPSSPISVEILTKNLEQKTKEFSGRKVLYSRSYYSEAEFWEIYSKPDYESLRFQTFAKGKWPEITTKVLNK